MKKVILSAAALLIGAVSFAQISGAPTAQTVTALPGAATTANAGESIQNGNNHKVQVRQAGTNQSVYTEQNDGSTVAGGNLAAVYQTGDVNPPSGVENAAEVLQSGATNESTTIQQGDYNNAYTAQGQNDDASTGNKARIQQGNNEQAEGNYAAVEQDGSYNEASTLQRWDNNDALTIQDGEYNKSMVAQAAAPDGSSGHAALTYQLGESNESSIDQSGAGARNRALTNQVGDNNHAKQIQTTTATEGMTGNQGSIYQGYVGDVIGGGQDYPLYDEILIDQVLPLDSYGGSTFQPSSSYAVAFQTQNGKEQRANIDQYGGSEDAYNYGEQEQASGWGNDAYMLQEQEGANGNYAKQYQAGDNNQVGLAQYGSGFKSAQTQIGHRNNAMAMQQGEDNLLNMHQRGNDNAATSAQQGIANATLIVQRDGQSYVAQQNLGTGGGPSFGAGGNNQIDALQLGPNGDFSTDGILCDFDPEMPPMVIPDVPTLTLDDICPDC